MNRVLQGFDVPCKIVLANGETVRFGTGAPKFTVTLHSNRVLAKGLDEFALGEAFVNGELDIEGDMMTFFDVRHQLKQKLGLMPWLQFWSKLLFLAPTRVNRAAIKHHYEFGDEFFLCFIDSAYHLYSHGFFASDDETLEMASERKLETVYRWTALQPGMRVLDIGAGWGGVTRYLGPRGVHVTSLTLAQDSYEHIQNLLKEHRYPGQVLLEDFLEHRSDKPYDAIVILGVIEHIPYYRKFFRQAWDLLKPGGLIYMDASADLEKYGVSRYIRHFIYPGTHSYMCLQDVLQEQLFHGFMPRQVVQDNHDYMLTMRHWAERFEANREMICRRWGDALYRAFWLYLWSGAYAFGHDVLQAYHLVAERTENPGPRPGALRRARYFLRQQV
ncbi:MAG: class I SAM-dependent methyltransferase [Candidatus Lambdaproteobacteria bacterium]|nr:class I SAM-dependent methyltransferase [Candidatus Lambdaproteobacteria bacterium]